MRSSASDSKARRSKLAPKAKFPAGLGEKERLSRSKLKQTFLIDSDAELFMYLFNSMD